MNKLYPLILAYFMTLSVILIADPTCGDTVELLNEFSINQHQLDFIDAIKVPTSPSETERIYGEMQDLIEAGRYSIVAVCMVEGNSQVSAKAASLLSEHTDKKLLPFYLRTLNERILPELKKISRSGRSVDKYRRNVIDKLFIYNDMELPEERTIDELLMEVGRTGNFSLYENLYFTNTAEIRSLAQKFNLIAKANDSVEETHLNESSMLEVIEEVTAPKPAIEEPAEVVVAEPVEEGVEQSSNWWLWLIGVVVVIGGILVLRPKK